MSRLSRVPLVPPFSLRRRKKDWFKISQVFKLKKLEF